MRYFRAFYDIDEETSDRMSFRNLAAIHAQFENRVFVLPYHRSGWCDSEGKERFAATLIARDGTMTMSGAQSFMNRALQIWGLESASLNRIEECTVEDAFMDSSTRTYTPGNIDECQIRRLLNLQSTYSFISSGRNGMKEAIVNGALGWEKAIRIANETDYSDDLREELAHIFPESMRGDDEASPDGGLAIAPITYIVEGNAHSDAEDVIHLLIGAMQKAGRIGSGHAFAIDVDDHCRWTHPDNDELFRTYLNHQLIRAIEGNSLVIRYGMFDTPGDYDMKAYALLTLILDLIEGAACQTQLFISVPEGKRDLVMRLRKRYNKPIVVLGKNRQTGLGSASFEGNLERMRRMAEDRGIEPDESMGTLLSKRMREGKSADLESVFEEWAAYHEARIAFPQYASVIEEAINLNARDEGESAMARLDGLIGLDGVKEHIKNIILRVEMGQRMLERGNPIDPFSMHMAFLGSPGTGKTEVARLYAEILKDMGVLSEGRLVSVSGGSGFGVKRAFEEARGSVLFVDEAYELPLHVSIAEFIAQMENNRNDTVVILAGYEGPMNGLFDCNPGFRSRVQTIVKFPDYTNDELLRIFCHMSDAQNMILGPEVKETVRDTVARGGKRADQGNARFIRKMFEDAVGQQQVRLAKAFKETEEPEFSLDELRTLLVEDVQKAVSEMGIVSKHHEVSGREELAQLIGLEEIKRLVSARMDFARMQKVKRDAGMKSSFMPMHMAFKGNPGTGKTQVARLIGRILREEGVLSVGDFYECGKDDLVSPMNGASAMMVTSLFQEARGSIIFIDEAYSLIGSDEAITAIIDQMEKLREEVVVIFAGYTKEIEALFSMNPGFNSRVKVHLDFPDYGPDELVEILCHMADKEGYVLDDGVKDKVREIVGTAVIMENFGNARFVRTLLEDAIVNQSVRLAEDLANRGAVKEGPGYSVEELALLKSEDFVWEKPASTRRAVGFLA